MREPVLNSACVGLGLTNMDDAISATMDIEQGLISLFSSGHILKQLRLHAPLHEIEIFSGVTLYDVFLEICNRTSDRGRFLMLMATKCPIDKDLADEKLADLINWRLTTHPDCLSLLLCAVSDVRIPISLSWDERWATSPLKVTVCRDNNKSECLRELYVHNVFSFQNAKEIVEIFNNDILNSIDLFNLWYQKGVLFPRLKFGPGVQNDLQGVGPEIYRAAVGRLSELNRAAVEWEISGAASPTYFSKVTGESGATMKKFGNRRIFLSAEGKNETFEKHAWVPMGHRLHLRELHDTKLIEVGYIGTHLPTVSFH